MCAGRHKAQSCNLQHWDIPFTTQEYNDAYEQLKKAARFAGCTTDKGVRDYVMEIFEGRQITWTRTTIRRGPGSGRVQPTQCPPRSGRARQENQATSSGSRTRQDTPAPEDDQERNRDDQERSIQAMFFNRFKESIQDEQGYYTGPSTFSEYMDAMEYGLGPASESDEESKN